MNATRRESVMTTLNDWNELASRDTDGLVVSLLWSRVNNRVKVVLDDTRIQRQFEFAVPADCALDAFYHPFLYAGPDVLVAAPTRAEEVAV
jgi:hypothetical protein